jgi:Cu(I)-responsive transcriptional regulator
MGSSAPKYFELAEARGDGLMSIGRAADASGVSAKMIRHYESIGLLAGATRTVAGYRVYRETDVHTLRFIRRARDLGFSMKEIEALLGLWQNRKRASADVKKLAAKHMQTLEEKIREMQSMRDAISHLAGHCHGDGRPECPILEDLASPAALPARAPRKAGAALRLHGRQSVG